MTPKRSESGYAVVAAVAGIAFFALAASLALSMSRGAVSSGTAEVEQAQAAAAADAGLALALNGLLAQDRAYRWSIDGRTRTAHFDTATLSIRVEDERGKVPLNRLDEELLDNLLVALGLDGERKLIARDSFLDWVDDDDEPRPYGAEAEYYKNLGIHPRNSSFLTLDELSHVRGFDREMVTKLKAFSTLYLGSGSFDSRYAQPAALDILQGGGITTPAALERQRELDGERPAIELGDAVKLTGRPLEVTVDAVLPSGARTQHHFIIELTGAITRPYVIRSYE